MKKLVIIGLILGFNTSAFASKVGESHSSTCTESDQSSRAPKSIVDGKKDSKQETSKDKKEVISK